MPLGPVARVLSRRSPRAAGKPAPAEMVIKSSLVSKLIILKPRSAARAAAGLDGRHRGAPQSPAAGGRGKSRVAGSEKHPLSKPECARSGRDQLGFRQRGEEVRNRGLWGNKPSTRPGKPAMLPAPDPRSPTATQGAGRFPQAWSGCQEWDFPQTGPGAHTQRALSSLPVHPVHPLRGVGAIMGLLKSLDTSS